MIKEYFYKKILNSYIEQLLKHHLGRVKKSYMKKVCIRHLKDDVLIKGAFAFINLDFKPKRITFQYPALVAVVDATIINFLNDNVIDAIKHEFAHLKYQKEGEKHLKWMNDQKLFKKDKKKNR